MLGQRNVEEPGNILRAEETPPSALSGDHTVRGVVVDAAVVVHMAVVVALVGEGWRGLQEILSSVLVAVQARSVPE
jgi:hypothetical protein